VFPCNYETVLFVLGREADSDTFAYARETAHGSHQPAAAFVRPADAVYFSVPKTYAKTLDPETYPSRTATRKTAPPSGPPPRSKAPTSAAEVFLVIAAEVFLVIAAPPSGLPPRSKAPTYTAEGFFAFSETTLSGSPRNEASTCNTDIFVYATTMPTLYSLHHARALRKAATAMPDLC
jgi:hypothetical protein